jgi:hypothetical protein
LALSAAFDSPSVFGAILDAEKLDPLLDDEKSFAKPCVSCGRRMN